MGNDLDDYGGDDEVIRPEDTTPVGTDVYFDQEEERKRSF